MLRSTLVLTALLTGLTAPALGQDRRTSEAEAAAAQAEEAAADVMRAAAQGPDMPMNAAPTAIEPLAVEPAFVEPGIVGPVDVESGEIAERADEPIEDAPALAIDWIAEPVVQPLGDPASGASEEFVEADDSGMDAKAALAFEDAPEQAAPLDDALPTGSEPMLAYASPLDEAAQPAPRAAQRKTRRVQLAYSLAERDAWLAQCRVVYRGSYDCDGYLARYEQAFGATTPVDRAMPVRTVTP